MKLYPNLVKAITVALEEIFTNVAYADITVEQTLKKDARWGARDRRFIAGNIYDIVRWYRLYQSCLTGAQQTTNLYYSIFAVAHILKGFELPQWEEFASINSNEIKEAYIKLVGHSIGHEQIYRVLRRHGYRKIMPRSRHPKKAGDEEIEQSKKKLLAWYKKQK